VSYDDQRARWAVLRADQNVIDQAAARLRHETAQTQYRGLRNPQVAFGLAAILDELSRHLRNLDEALRRRVGRAVQGAAEGTLTGAGEVNRLGARDGVGLRHRL
jgi:adenylosuccinate lyase